MIQFGCEPCKNEMHDQCVSLYRYDEETTAIVRREQPSPTHCDCQHRVRKS